MQRLSPFLGLVISMITMVSCSRGPTRPEPRVPESVALRSPQSCLFDRDCSGGETCWDRTCRRDGWCSRDDQCGSGWVCSSNRCMRLDDTR